MLLADLPNQELEAYLRTGTFEAFTPKTITERASIREEVRRIASSGVAYDDAEFSHELRCVAAPDRNYTRQTVAALGISSPVCRSRDLGFKEQPRKQRASASARKHG